MIYTPLPLRWALRGERGFPPERFHTIPFERNAVSVAAPSALGLPPYDFNAIAGAGEISPTRLKTPHLDSRSPPAWQNSLRIVQTHPMVSAPARRRDVRLQARAHRACLRRRLHRGGGRSGAH